MLRRTNNTSPFFPIARAPARQFRVSRGAHFLPEWGYIQNSTIYAILALSSFPLLSSPMCMSDVFGASSTEGRVE